MATDSQENPNVNGKLIYFGTEVVSEADAIARMRHVGASEEAIAAKLADCAVFHNPHHDEQGRFTDAGTAADIAERSAKPKESTSRTHVLRSSATTKSSEKPLAKQPVEKRAKDVAPWNNLPSDADPKKSDPKLEPWNHMPSDKDGGPDDFNWKKW